MDKLPSKTVEMVELRANADYPNLTDIRDSIIKVINHLEIKV